MIQVDISNIWGELSLPDLLAIEKEVADAHAMLMEASGAGWLDLPQKEESEELCRILDAADKIRSGSDVCVVVGISRGAQAVIELLQGRDRNLRKTPQIFYAGDSLSTRRWQELKELLEGKDFSVIVISGADTALETAIAFRELRWMLERKYGTDEASDRICVVTDSGNSALEQMAREAQWQTFVIPAGVGEGFSVLSPAGLLPMAAAGIDVSAVLKGARDAKAEYGLRSFENPVWLYAGVRNSLYRRGKVIELFGGFEPGFRAFGAWWQQLFAGSEGRGGQGIFPVTAELTGDLYSLGQLICQGQRNLFETMVCFAPPAQKCVIGGDWKNLDQLNYLEGKTLDAVERAAFEDAAAAHADSGVPVITMDCGPLQEETVGELIYFLELACGVSAGVLRGESSVPPAGQVYRQEMFAVLGRPENDK